ncbi:phosphonate ABC transporter, permease protein PhnE [Alkalicoccobacillus murimartini]|uniref:Phosphonate transport system permease protein n=1 Tax=Alkalicoccobacillus murimartini TaxID=171685 RepID=A0ABT9YIP7_9BACI|nr:phosphonate ABC transporter, permease protein PhnE [Alkalicoccobacillus murimartini]MDQ0207360.1 phosphonate transport system permease protein [Alkalicoccobacillus murimartini]
MSNLPPPRFSMPPVWSWIVIVGFVGFFMSGMINANISLDRIVAGSQNIGTFLSRAVPPDVSRWSSISMAMLETFEIALVGTVFGVIISLPIALLISKNTTPHPLISTVIRFIVSIMRTVPDLVWALLFVISVGLGPFAGILTIMVDTTAFCARFFSERIEEMDKGPREAIQSTGSNRLGVYSASIVPIGFPSFVATSLFSVEKAIRSAVVLGLVGAGGIGIELSTSMSLMKYDEAFMIIIIIFIVVVLVEQLSAAIRKRIL